MKLVVNYGNEAFSVPGALLERISDMSETELAVLLSMCADPSLRTDAHEAPAVIAEAIGKDTDEVEAAINTLRGMGFLSTTRTSRRAAAPKRAITISAEKREEPFIDTQQRVAVMPISMPEYTGEQIKGMIDETPMYKVIVDETQKICGTMFTPTEVSRVLSLADYLKLEFEHILMLFTYCKSRGKTSVQYAVKTAYTLYNQGIDTKAAFEEYVKKSEQFDTVAGKVRSIFGMGERAFTAKEKELIASWCRAEVSTDLIARAYEITVNNTGKASVAYAGKVIENWLSKGYRTLIEIEAAEAEYRREREEGSGSFKTDEFFEAALKRGREKMGE